jgi:hypothetical protein
MTWLFDWLLRLTSKNKPASHSPHEDDDEEDEDEEDEEWERGQF